MKNLLTLLSLLFCVIATSFAQKHLYTYDPSGNRIKREYVMLRVKQQAELPTQFALDTNVAKEESFNMRAFPNPFNESVSIQLESEEELKGDERLLLFSENGVLQFISENNQKSEKIIIN